MKYLMIVLIATNLFAIPPYKRSYFKHWQDFNHDCQSTRSEILIRDNLNTSILFKTDKQCNIVYGIWYDHYTDSILTNSNMVDVEHVVALKSAWESGAWKWTDKKRELYANDMTYDWHLLPVTKGDNRSKGFKSPNQWMPPNKKFHIAYCIIWIHIKVSWGLTATQEENDFIRNVLVKHDKRKNKSKWPRVYPKVRE